MCCALLCREEGKARSGGGCSPLVLLKENDGTRRPGHLLNGFAVNAHIC